MLPSCTQYGGQSSLIGIFKGSARVAHSIRLRLRQRKIKHLAVLVLRRCFDTRGKISLVDEQRERLRS